MRVNVIFFNPFFLLVLSFGNQFILLVCFGTLISRLLFYILLFYLSKSKNSLFLGILWVLPFSLKGLSMVAMGTLWTRREERLGEQLFFAFFGQFGRKKPKVPLKRCNALSSLLRTPSLLIYTCGPVGIFS